MVSFAPPLGVSAVQFLNSQLSTSSASLRVQRTRTRTGRKTPPSGTPAVLCDEWERTRRAAVRPRALAGGQPRADGRQLRKSETNPPQENTVLNLLIPDTYGSRVTCHAGHSGLACGIHKRINHGDTKLTERRCYVLLTLGFFTGRAKKISRGGAKLAKARSRGRRFPPRLCGFA